MTPQHRELIKKLEPLEKAARQEADALAKAIKALKPKRKPRPKNTFTAAKTHSEQPVFRGNT